MLTTRIHQAIESIRSRSLTDITQRRAYHWHPHRPLYPHLCHHFHRHRRRLHRCFHLRRSRCLPHPPHHPRRHLPLPHLHRHCHPFLIHLPPLSSPLTDTQPGPCQPLLSERPVTISGFVPDSVRSHHHRCHWSIPSCSIFHRFVNRCQKIGAYVRPVLRIGQRPGVDSAPKAVA